MSELSQILGNAGAPFEIRTAKRTYRAKMIDQSVQDGFAKALFAKARDAAMVMKEMLSTEEYSEHLKKLNDDFVEGEYDMLSPRGMKTLQTHSGALTLCSLIFDADSMEVVELMLTHREEVLAMMNLIITESLPSASKAKENGQVKSAVPTQPV